MRHQREKPLPCIRTGVAGGGELMARYLMTHSLLSSWLYAMEGNPYEDMTTERDPMAEFMQVLRREPTETTPAMQDGIDFEDLVTRIAKGTPRIGDAEEKTYEAACKAANRVRGGTFQLKVYKDIVVKDMNFLLYGRVDVLKAGEVIDIKFSKSYDRGKYFDSTQHPTYLELVPEAQKFTYLVSNGSEVWQETYLREETPCIYDTISDFVDWLVATGYMPVYKQYWAAK